MVVTEPPSSFTAYPFTCGIEGKHNKPGESISYKLSLNFLINVLINLPIEGKVILSIPDNNSILELTTANTYTAITPYIFPSYTYSIEENTITKNISSYVSTLKV